MQSSQDFERFTSRASAELPDVQLVVSEIRSWAREALREWSRPDADVSAVASCMDVIEAWARMCADSMRDGEF